MLRLLQAIKECKIPQQAFVKSSGYSKALVSRVLNTGTLPTDTAKFASAVTHFMQKTPAIRAWLEIEGLPVEALMDSIMDISEGGASLPSPSPDLERVLCEIAGRAMFNRNPASYMVICMARCANHLRQKLADMVGADAPYMQRVESEAVGIISIDISEGRA
jgi:hypothetical protein